MTDNKKPHPTDIHVGARVKAIRIAAGMSLEMLGKRLGLTFQQVQKYERGGNRIGSSRLLHIAQILGVRVEAFFEGLQTGDAAPALEAPTEILLSRRGQDLARNFLAMPPHAQAALADIAQAIAEAYQYQEDFV